jgi:hypothetical protein
VRIEKQRLCFFDGLEIQQGPGVVTLDSKDHSAGIENQMMLRILSQSRLERLQRVIPLLKTRQRIAMKVA